MNHKYITFAIVILTSIILFNFPNTQSQGSDLANEIIRLHVLANSDSAEDQSLKLKLKEEILQLMSKQLSHAASADEIKIFIDEHGEELRVNAENFLKGQGYDYPVSLSLSNVYFPTKSYGDFVFPAGEYEALRIVIGEGKGKNWWCVLYPPLCFVDVTDGVVPPESKQLLQNVLSEEDYSSLSIINYDEADVQVKFKLLEWFKKK